MGLVNVPRPTVYKRIGSSKSCGNAPSACCGRPDERVATPTESATSITTTARCARRLYPEVTMVGSLSVRTQALARSEHEVIVIRIDGSEIDHHSVVLDPCDDRHIVVPQLLFNL